jgi:hypothetical protein
MMEIFGIIKRHNEELQEEIRDAIVEYEVGEKKIKFEDVPSICMSQDTEIEIGGKEYKYTLSVAILSGEDQRTEQVKSILKEIEDNPNVSFH